MNNPMYVEIDLADPKFCDGCPSILYRSVADRCSVHDIEGGK